MITVNIDEIQQDLSAFIKLIQEGNSLIITQTDQPIAEITPIIKQPEIKRRPIGLCEGEFIVPDDFNDPLPEEIIIENHLPLVDAKILTTMVDTSLLLNRPWGNS